MRLLIAFASAALVVSSAFAALASTPCNPNREPISSEDFEVEVQSYISASNPIMQTAAYTNMLAILNLDVLSAVIDQGLSGDVKNEGVRNAAKSCKFTISSSLTIRALEYSEAKERMPDLTESGEAEVRSAFSLPLRLYAVEDDDRCKVSNASENCDGPSAVTMQAGTLAYGDARSRTNGVFTMQDDGRWLGEVFKFRGAGHGYTAFPAEALLN